MTDTTAFLVEDFVHSIAAQLDRVQDALRLKAVNRPLTYALKDFSVDLHVFPEVDAEGHVRFRTAGANETGASEVHLAFTTITRPMIEENTVSLQASQGPGLDESGLSPEEQRRLEQLGVRNVAQLQKLQRYTSSSTIQRLARVPADRLREALSRGRPAIDRVVIKPPAPAPPAKPPSLVMPSPAAPRPFPTPALPPPGAPNPVRVRLEGRNFLGGAAPRATFEGRPVPIASLEDEAIEVDLPGTAGSLALELEDGEARVFAIGEASESNGKSGRVFDDPWRCA
jgi:hypothetical protein